VVGTTPQKVTKVVEILPQVTYLSVNRRELENLHSHFGDKTVNVEIPRIERLPEEIVRKAVKVYTLSGVRHLIVTLGENGVLLVHKEQNGTTNVRHFPALRCERIVDVTGAGDGLAAGVIAALLSGRSISQAIVTGLEVARTVLQNGGFSQIGPHLLSPNARL